MKAVVYEKYGSADVLQLKDIPKPNPKENEILVKIYATSVTAGDWRLRKADPFLARIFNGLFKPRKVKVLGFELAGIVEGIGKEVKNFKIGDSVFASCGLSFGGYAEYKCLPENNLIAHKPSNITFEEAATVPIGGLTALRFLKQTKIQPGMNILIYGASGSVGTFAIQIAKYFGANVCAVASAKNIELVKSLGADTTIDYIKQDFTQINQKFDIVFDAVGKTSKSKCKNILNKNAVFVSVARNAKTSPNDMQVLKELLEKGKLKSVIDREYTLDQIQEAHKYVESFRKKGNVVVSVCKEGYRFE
jgi:NADPH:quinone reductase-like Zn-dependent oxidoreductase